MTFLVSIDPLLDIVSAANIIPIFAFQTIYIIHVCLSPPSLVLAVRVGFEPTIRI